MALYEGLTEYDPKTTQPIPAIAERWDVNADASEFVFHLRPNARWSNGEPITAHDFVYSFRRGLDPAFAARNAYMAYYILHAQGFNEGGVFVRDPGTGAFVLEPSDVSGESDGAWSCPATTAARQKSIDADPALRAAVAGKEFVPVRAEDIGVEAVDDHTLRITLTQPAPFFVGMMAHQFFKVGSHGRRSRGTACAGRKPDNIVTSGAFTAEGMAALRSHRRRRATRCTGTPPPSGSTRSASTRSKSRRR